MTIFKITEFFFPLIVFGHDQRLLYFVLIVEGKTK